MGRVWRHVFQTALAALFAFSAITASAAIFDDGNDRHFVKDLRAKDPASLTDEERAILAAANKVGVIGLCGGKNAGNAFLILYRGRPAVVTAAHFAFNPKNGAPYRCSSDAEFAQGLAYMPNTSFYSSAQPDRNRDFVFRQVGLEFPPANWAGVRGKRYNAQDDFLVFYLQEDISREAMPDGSKRGYLTFAETQPAKGKLYMLGLSGDMGARNMEILYQSRCDGFLASGSFHHGCDAVDGSSASLIGVLEDGEIKFRGLHRGGHDLVRPADGNYSNFPAHAKNDRIKANIATSSAEISALMKRESGRPDFLASDLQWLLTRAGCYSGKLDNQWGPHSRKALATFTAAAAIELPGTEPSAELLAAVEKVAPEGTQVCR